MVSGPATVSGNTVTITGAGTVSLQASQAATTNYTAATATTSFAVSQQTPTLVFASIPAKTYGDAAFSVSASSASSGTITYSVVSGPATISGSTVTITGAGTSTLQASQAVTTNYTVATATASFTVNPKTPTLTFASIPAKSYGDAAFLVSASSVSTGAITYSVVSGPATVSESAVTITGAGTVVLQAAQAATINYTAATATTSFTVYEGTPSIITQPSSEKICKGSNASFSVVANNASDYAWYTQTGTYTGSGSTLTIQNITATNNGGYYCVASNSSDSSATSAIAYLTVMGATAPSIESQPESVSVYLTQAATFSVLVNATDTVSYRWYKNGAAIGGATSSSYTTGTLTASDNGSTYYVVVTDTTCGGMPLISTAATLTVSSTDTAVPPTIIVQPQGQTASVGNTAEYTVVASGSGTLSYQWYRVPYSSTQATTAGTVISGATGTMYTTSSVAQSNDGDVYFVRATNAYGSAVSGRALLTVGSGISLQISGQPQSQTISANTEADFNVTATGTGCTPAYQWYWYAPGKSIATKLTDGTVTSSSSTLSGAVVAGATTASLSIQNTPTTASGGYSVIFWPKLIPTTNFTVKLTVALSSGSIAADGFTMILADPTQGATSSSLGDLGGGLGAKGIPGVVLGFDTYQNECSSTITICDPITVPYMAIGQGATALWENPWINVNGYLNTQSSSDYTVAAFANSTHDYVIKSNNGTVTVTMDGYELFNGSVSMPPAAYLGFTASTGSFNEEVTLSKMSVVVGTN
ncbi:MAG: immunoglobulin domain-containing protein [Terracidiphilus sp.]|nr:immunoglobulin domain-containing protein [Terracidiphilus sp.]